MKRLFVILISFGLLGFFACQQNGGVSPVNESTNVVNSSVKPAANLIGEAVVYFTFTPPTFWNGTVDFETDGKYGITFISHGPPRDYSNASPFEEDFIIYTLNTDWTLPENVVMKGWLKGVTTLAKEPLDPAKFITNGKVNEAYGHFEEWQGRSVHQRGSFTWLSEGVPDVAISTFRIN